MRTMHKTIVAAAAGLTAMLGSLAVAVPAQAAPPATLTRAQVEQTTNRSTARGPYSTKFRVTIELRAGYYQGYQYGWARVVGGWQQGDVIWLRIYQNGSRDFVHPSYNEHPNQSPAITAGQITRADINYRFSACLQRGNDYDCTAEW